MATTENLYVGDGSTVLYSFTFPYINEADVKVSLNQLNTTAFTLSNATTVEFDAAPGTGVSIRIYRETPTDTASSVFFPGSAIRAQDLNANFEQSLYVVQENQAIIENSDAASVVGIANEALATANQANATANAVSGTADTALTTSNEAEATANQALSDASTANDAANAARVVADAALNPGSVISDLSNVSATAPASNQVLAWSGSQWSPVDQTGEGGGGTVVNYSGAAAWGDFESSGALTASLNASVAFITTGQYQVTFTTPLPSANYVVTTGGPASIVQTSGKTANGFVYNTADASGAATNYGGSFAAHALNALPPKGGTGTDCWGSVASDGTLEAGFNIASVTRTATGRYDVVFTTPMPTSNYSALVSTNADASSSNVMAYDLTSTGFSVRCNGSGGSEVDRAFSFTVNATNATLPLTFNSEQVESAINNPGASAWGNIAADGTVNGGLNIASVTNTGTGVYDVVFTTPMPGVYAVTGTSINANRFVFVTGQNANGFGIELRNQSNNPVDDSFGFTVFSTNALPPRGGTGTDAWLTSDSTGVVLNSFNIASVTRTATGFYDVVFTTPMLDANYALVGSALSAISRGVLFQNVTANGFTASTYNTNTNSSENSAFSVQVNATNATLPTTFSAAQIQSVLDFIAVANPVGVAKAWGSIDGATGNALDSLNATSSRLSTGVYQVTFTSPMSNANYAPVISTDQAIVAFVQGSVINTGFQIATFNVAGLPIDGYVSFTVHST